MLDPRIYRAALVPALLALIVVAFSLRDRPRPVGTTLAPIAFNGARAWQDLGALAGRFPDRRPGSAGDAALGDHVAAQLRRLGFRVRTVTRSAMTIDGRRDLRTVIAERTGTLDRRIVVVAHRDASDPGSRAELSGTEGLLELARVFGAPRRTQRTLTLVSTSGGAGAAGAADLPSELGAGGVDAALVLGDLASVRSRRPFVSGWSDDLSMAPLRLRRTVEESLRAELGSDVGGSRAIAQWVRFAAPATLGEQGPLNAAGIPAVLLSATSERGPDSAARTSEGRLQAFGSAALRALTALDGVNPVGRSPSVAPAALVVRRKMVPAWSVRLLVGVLLLAPILALVDASARLRRRREPIAPWVRWVLVAAITPLAGLAFARALGLTGLIGAPPGPVAPAVLPPQLAGIVAVALVLALVRLAAHPALVRALGPGRGDPGAPGAALAVVGVLCAVTVLIWVRNPYAAVLLVPAVHLWLFTLSPDLRPRRGAGLALVALGVVPLVLLALAEMVAFGLGPADAVWFALLLVAGGHTGPLAWVLWSVVAGCVACAVVVAWRGRAAVPPSRAGGAGSAVRDVRSVRGPASYAGPGSLGGVESGLPR